MTRTQPSSEYQTRRAEIAWQGYYEGLQIEMATRFARSLEATVFEAIHLESYRELLQDAHPTIMVSHKHGADPAFEYADAFGHRYRVTVEMLEPQEIDLDNQLRNRRLDRDPRPEGKRMAERHMEFERAWKEVNA